MFVQSINQSINQSASVQHLSNEDCYLCGSNEIVSPSGQHCNLCRSLSINQSIDQSENEKI